MRAHIIGGGPAGLYLSILLKKADPTRDVHVFERNPEDVTWGWGVVFSDETLGHFKDADEPSYTAITSEFRYWSVIDTFVEQELVQSGGHGFCGIARMRLLQLMAQRATELGVQIHFDHDVNATSPEDPIFNADLVVAADGINSPIRTLFADHFKPKLVQGEAYFIWLGTDLPLETFTFVFHQSEHGMFQVHSYPFSDTRGTFIVETDKATFERAGLASMGEQESIEYCEKMFGPWLKGHKLYSNNSHWIRFRHVTNETWHRGNVVLIGDAAHTAHFSIGSGTKLAMEDAIDLAAAVERNSTIEAALADYQETRWVDVAKLQKTAKTSQRWFEVPSRYATQSPLQLTFNMMSRSKRVTHSNLKLRDPGFIEKVDRDFAASQGLELSASVAPPPPMFVPLTLKDVTLKNRVVVSPMCQYSAADGAPGDWHLVHYGSLAKGGAGLVFAEMTDVVPEGRITTGCTGLYSPAHLEGWRRIVQFCKANSDAVMGIQLGHAGRKGATTLPWAGKPDQALPEGQAWPIVAPSPVPYKSGSQTPRVLERADMDALLDAYRASAKMALDAGFDLIEIHMAHGYLLAEFLSPLVNKRTDEYGGDVHGRLKFPLEVLDAVREVWPASKPLFVRISAVDWIDGGQTEDDAVEVARALKAHGVDVIDVSTGQTAPGAQPEYGRMYQTPFADRIRHEVGIRTMAVGAIEGWDHCNTILAAGRADLCAMARPHLYDPFLTLHAAREQEHYDVRWPVQYTAVKPRPRA